jgi:hypothetical protein
MHYRLYFHAAFSSSVQETCPDSKKTRRACSARYDWYWHYLGILGNPKRRNVESNRVWTDVIGEEEVTYVSTHEGGLPTTPPALQHGAFIINLNHQLIHRIFILPFIRVILCIDRALFKQL